MIRLCHACRPVRVLALLWLASGLASISTLAADATIGECPPIVHLVDRTLERGQLAKLLAFRGTDQGRCLRSGQLVVFDDVVIGVDDAANDLAWQRLLPPAGSSVQRAVPAKANLAVGLERAVHAVNAMPRTASEPPRIAVYARLTLGSVAEASVRYREWLDRVVLPELADRQAALYLLVADRSSRVLAGSLLDAARNLKRVDFDAGDRWQSELRRWFTDEAAPLALPPAASPPASVTASSLDAIAPRAQPGTSGQGAANFADRGKAKPLVYGLAALGLSLTALALLFVFRRRRRRRRRPLSERQTPPDSLISTPSPPVDSQPTHSRYRPLHEHPTSGETALTEELSSWDLPPERFHR